jgi:hypothetical protein
VSVEVRIDRGRLARMLRSRGGMMARHLRRRNERVARRAEQLAPGSMGRYISHRIVEGPRGLTGVVTCDHPATVYVINGTRPHVIRPRRAKALKFTVDGRTVFATVVHHPGTKANNFLAEAMRQVL